MQNQACLNYAEVQPKLNNEVVNSQQPIAKMKTLLIAIGKTDNKYLTAATDDYLGRANHYAPIEMKIIPDIRDVKNLSQEQQKIR